MIDEKGLIGKTAQSVLPGSQNNKVLQSASFRQELLRGAFEPSLVPARALAPTLVKTNLPPSFGF
jgi:hypothetical protein